MSEPHHFASSSIEFGAIRLWRSNVEVQHRPPVYGQARRPQSGPGYGGDRGRVGKRTFCDAGKQADALLNVDRFNALGQPAPALRCLRDIYGGETAIFPCV